MNEYEKQFISRMEQVGKDGLDFEAGARLAMEAKFGGAAEVLFRDMGDEAKRDPKKFVEELSRMFGRGSMGFLEPVMKSAERGLFPPMQPAQSALDSVLSRLGPDGGAGSSQKVGPLHEHRIKDEEENYSDAYN